MMRKLLNGLIILFTLSMAVACKKSNNPHPGTGSTGTSGTTDATGTTGNTDTAKLYFPPITGTTWQTTTATSLGWDQKQLDALYPYLQSAGTKAFIILKDGKIVCEQYFGTFTADSLWYWASAGKTVTGLLVGIAQRDGLLNINDQTSKYIGTGWTSEPLAKENLHHDKKSTDHDYRPG